MSSNVVLKISNVSRTFGAIQALKEANFEINEGEIMGLVGENGAGKSTLVKIISGFDPGFKGSYQINGQEVKFESPSQAEESGIAIAQQELSLIPNMSVAENIFLTGAKVKKFATLNTLSKMARPYLDEVGLTEVDPTTRINLLSVGEQHLVEVARLISREAKILILDEPTAALGEAESRRILEMVERLAANGKSIIYVSHRLDEIFKITKRITILRDGVSQGVQQTKDIDVNKLVEIMLGRELANMFPSRADHISDEAQINIKELRPDGVLEPVSFSAFKGENLTSPALSTISKYGFNFGDTEENYSKSLAKDFLVDVKRMYDESGLLSGGNQQKVALGKWLSIKPDVLLVNEPTRGVDVGAKSEIYQRMRELASRGITIIFASTDIQEITYLPDRVITFYRGMMIDEHRLEHIKTPIILKEITEPFNETNL